jgi:hypothetical protein
MKSTLLVLIIFLLPFSIWAKTLLTDSELSDISGQAGVSFVFDITMNIHFDVLAWGDSDGLGTNNIWGTNTNGGYVGVKNLTITNLNIRSRTDASYGLYPLTIDVAYDSYYLLNLSSLQNPFMPWNPR